MTDAGLEDDRPSREQRVATAQAVVYDEEGELIDAAALDNALREHGVEIGESEDGLTEYRNVPRNLPLSACHLAVDTRQDPAEFIADLDEYALDADI